MRTHSRLLQYVGAALIVLAMPLSWWSLTRTRIYEERGVDLGSIAQAEAITKDMTPEENAEYIERRAAFNRAWSLNTGRFQDFYFAEFGDNYAKLLNDEMLYTLRSGTLTLRGWSTWTGWFGVVFVGLLFAAQHAPKFSEDLEPIAWSFPLALAGVFGFFTLMAIWFYFGVPDPNDVGISQGVGLGNYLAILGGLVATTGSVFEGLKSMNARLAELAAESEDDADESEGDAPAEEKPKPKPLFKSRKEEPPPERKKSRLEDW